MLSFLFSPERITSLESLRATNSKDSLSEKRREKIPMSPNAEVQWCVIHHHLLGSSDWPDLTWQR